MCPPASIPSAVELDKYSTAPIPSVVELDEYSTDETICKLLMQLQSGHTPPHNVLLDVDPYQYLPANLPADMWYFSSGSKMDTKIGFWKSTGGACEIYSTPLIVVLRKTLQFYEGPAPDVQKTNWIMQEYRTTEIYTSKLDPRALYRVFLVDNSSSGGDHLSKSEVVKKTDDVAGPSDVANQFSDQLLGDYVSEGDYLELDDLATPLSRTTSFDSSCMTMSLTSEEFDSDALLRELGGGDVVDQDSQESKIKLNLSVPAKSKQVVMQPTALESVDKVKESKPCSGQTSITNPTPEHEITSSEVDTLPPPPPQSSPPSPVPPTQPPQFSLPSPPLPSSPASSPPPSSQRAAPSSSNSSEGSSKEEKKDHANRTKKRKMMKYLCFLAF